MASAEIINSGGTIKRFSAAAAKTPGSVELWGNMVGVVSGTKPIAIGEDYTLIVDGPVELDATSADAWSDGDLLYWNASTAKLTDTASSNKTAGLAVGAKAASATRAVVYLNASVGSATV